MLLDTPEAELGWKATPFRLADPDGNWYSLSDLQGENGLLIAFICNHCPYVQATITRFVADARELKKEGINVVAISSNDYRYVPVDAPEFMKKFADHHNFGFPYLVDEDQSVGKAYGAVCTPDYFGFNAEGELQYRGRLDNARMGDTSGRTPELLNAMREIARTGHSSKEQYPSIGCSIKWS